MELLLNVYAANKAKGAVADFMGHCLVAPDEATRSLTPGLWLVRGRSPLMYCIGQTRLLQPAASVTWSATWGVLAHPAGRRACAAQALERQPNLAVSDAAAAQRWQWWRRVTCVTRCCIVEAGVAGSKHLPPGVRTGVAVRGQQDAGVLPEAARLRPGPVARPARARGRRARHRAQARPGEPHGERRGPGRVKGHTLPKRCSSGDWCECGTQSWLPPCWRASRCALGCRPQDTTLRCSALGALRWGGYKVLMGFFFWAYS